MPARRQRTPVLDEVEPAVSILSRALGITPRQAQAGLRELVRAGYVIGPREPTNGMLLAYITSYGQMPVNPATTITAIGKARRRWKAMADQATGMALSMRRTADAPDLVDDRREGDGKPGATGAADTPQAAGGRARAERLSPERRREIAAGAARTRWSGREAGTKDPGEKA